MIIMIKPVVFSDNFMSTETFTKCTEQTRMLQISKGNYSESVNARVMVLALCT